MATMKLTFLLSMLTVLVAYAVQTVSAQTTTAAPPATTLATDDTRLLNCPIDAETSDECDSTAYAYRVAYYALPGLIVGVLMFLICPFFHCCNCCGCCGCGADVPRSSWDVVRGKLYALVLCVLVAILSGLYGNISAGLLTEALLDVADATDGVPDTIGSELDAIETALTVQKYSAANDSYYEDNLFAGTSLATEGNKTRQDLESSTEGSLDDFRAVVQDFAFVLFILFTLPCVVAGVGLLAALCNIRTCLPMLVAALFFLLGFLLWTLFGLFSGVGLVIEDACAEIQGVVDQRKTVLVMLTGCKDSDFTAFTDNFEQIEKDTSKTSCESIEDLCYDSSLTAQQNAARGQTYNCGSNFPNCNTVFFADMVTLLDDIFIQAEIKALPGAVSDGKTCRNTTLNCTVRECGDDCFFPNGTRSPTGRSSLEMFTEFQAAEAVSLALESLGGRYGSCTAIYGVILGAFHPSCKDLVSGGRNVRNAYGVTAMLSVFAIIVMTMGTSRFMSFDEAAESRKPKDEGEDAPEGASTEQAPTVQKSEPISTV